MHGEGVRHPTTSVKNGYLPSSVPLCLLSMDVGLNQMQKSQFSIKQYTKNGICNLISFGFVQTLYFTFLYLLYFLGFWAIQWQDALEILTLNATTNNYIFFAIFRISLPLISKSKVVHRITGFWMINSLFGNFLP